MFLTDYALEKMGFEKLSDDECISGKFHAFHIYQVMGGIIDVEATDMLAANIGGIPYQISVGSDINKICRKLADDDLVNDLEAWQKEHECKPPYLVIHLGPTKKYHAAGCQVKKMGEILATYESFSDAKEELRNQGGIVLPRLLPALTSIFSTVKRPISFKKVYSGVFGKTSDGTTINDIRFVANIGLSVSSPIAVEELQSCIAQSSELASELDIKPAHFYHLALNEDDPMKKFLYFFLSIEIQTHTEFKSIDHDEELSALFTPPERAVISAKILFKIRNDYMKSLKDRFVWCVLCTWRDLTDLDVQSFLELRKVRDDIAHGSISNPPADAVVKVQELATKLHLQRVK